MKKLTYDEIVEKCRNVHGDKYVYPSDMVNRMGKDKKIPIICKEHGEFWQILHNHLKGCGCPKCGGNARVTTEEYVRSLKERFGGGNILFDKVEYKNNHTPITLTCKTHGDFTILPSSITDKLECPHCQKERLLREKTLTTEEFIDRARKVHGDKYDYSKVEYVNSKIKVCIVCPKHGEFWQLPHAHLNGQGCPLCSNEKLWNKRDKITLGDFLERAKKVHGDKYDYSKVEYVNTSTKVEIICPKHGSFWQTPEAHLRGQGCPSCGIDRIKEKFKLGYDKFVEKAKKVHGDKYDYSKVRYVNCNTKVEIICPKHGSFWQTPSCHVKCDGCPTCKGEKSVSNQETDFTNYIKEVYDSVVCLNDRQIINPLEVDVYLPFENMAFEYDGLYWHSSEKIHKKYHLNKTEECNKKGIRLIHVFEDEWLFKKEIVKSRIRSLLGLSEDKIAARKCKICDVPHDESKKFLEVNHIQGNVNSKYRYGLYYNDELVALMTFGSKRKSLGSKSEDGMFELLRFCNKINTNVIGGASRLLKHFIKVVKPKVIISYCDRRWSNGSMYEKIGFKLDHISEPNYFYIIGQRRENRFKYRKSELVRQGFDGSLTEEQIMKKRNIKKIYDCGNLVYKMIV